MNTVIRKAAVIGSGVMGAGIAAILANAGIKVLLLDIIPENNKASDEDSAVDRSIVARKAIDTLVKSRNSQLMVSGNAKYIVPGNLTDDLGQLLHCDFVIEVIVENFEIKAELFAKISNYINKNAIIASNTSGISINKMAEMLPETLKSRFLGVHFFNPPRLMKLVEVIPSDVTSPCCINAINDFLYHQLGKNVILAKDSPNFIANRIGVFANTCAMTNMCSMDMTIEEVDAIAGELLGRPKSAVFGTTDIVGVDLCVSVSKSLQRTLPDNESSLYKLPEFIEQMVDKGLLGNKSGMGFYCRKRNGQDLEIKVLDPVTLVYRERNAVLFGSIENAKSKTNFKDSFNALINGDDRGARFAWKITKDVLLYALEHSENIAYSINDVDRAMKDGFNWKCGPFELWDVLGIRRIVERMTKDGEDIPTKIVEMLKSGVDVFYRQNENSLYCYDFTSGRYKLIDSNEVSSNIVIDFDDVTLDDLGDGIACISLRGKNDVAPKFLAQAIQSAVERVGNNFDGLILRSCGKNFCVGANLKEFYCHIESGNWKAIEETISSAQTAMAALRFCKRPVVAAVQGKAFGGGAELMLHASRVLAVSEAEIGLVEARVGLIPAGGGTLEMLRRMNASISASGEAESNAILKRVFSNIFKSVVSKNAFHAKDLLYVRPEDRVVFQEKELISEAKATIKTMNHMGWMQSPDEPIQVRGLSGYALLKADIDYLKYGKYISEYSAVVGEKIASVLTGGNLTSSSNVSSEYILELEREAFLSLCGNAQTRERIKGLIETGKIVEN